MQWVFSTLLKLIIITSASFPLITELNIEAPEAEKQKLQKNWSLSEFNQHFLKA